jgi:nicotinamide mononucleotide transporter
VSVYEVVGFAFGLLSVVLTIRESLWCWPAGIVSVVAFGLLFYEIRLYADMALQGFYVVTGFLGWWSWRFGGERRTELRIGVLSARARAGAGLLAVLLPAVWAMRWYLVTYTDASLPGWDSLASTLSVFAQVLLMRKVFESWILWIAVDVLSVGIYLAKGVYLTAILYVVFLVLAILGLREWRRRLAAAGVGGAIP